LTKPSTVSTTKSDPKAIFYHSTASNAIHMAPKTAKPAAAAAKPAAAKPEPKKLVAVPSVIAPAVYKFLVECGFTKAAKELLAEAKLVTGQESMRDLSVCRPG